MIQVKVTPEQWSRLTQAERTLAKTLGITLETATKKAFPSKPKSEPKPYTIEVEIHCYLCGSDTEQFFHMELREGQSSPYLHSVKITKSQAQQLKKEMPYVTKIIEMSTCSSCFKALLKWEKEELAKKLIEVFPAARLSAITGGSNK